MTGLLARLDSNLRRDPEVEAFALERRPVKILQLSYRAPAYEAGPEKIFDFSRATLAERWQAGALDMEEAIGLARGARSEEEEGERGVRLSVWSKAFAKGKRLGKRNL